MQNPLKWVVRKLGLTAVDGYPFAFETGLTFSLTDPDGMRCSTKFTNRHDQEIPLGNGYHPYFCMGTDTIDELLLEFPAMTKLDLTNGIPTGKILCYNTFNKLTAIGTNEFDDCFRVAAENIMVSRLYNPNNGIELQIWQETGPSRYEYLQIYTPPHRKSIAIEPMSCAPDAFNNDLGIIRLEPGESCTLSWGIRLTRSEGIKDKVYSY